MYLVSWNVNGIRAVMKKGFLDWLNQVQADIVCLQEVRATPEQIPTELASMAGYHSYWFAAEKKGYSGVGILSKVEPLKVEYGIGIPEYDIEGRVITAEFEKFILINAYFPSGTRGLERVGYKLAFNEAFLEFCEARRHKPLIFCGDVNIAHRAIDLTHPKANEKVSGFLPEERAWMDKIVGLGYVDTYRHFYPDEPQKYTWWLVRGGARAKNVGWRIDYFICSAEAKVHLKDATILADVLGSDHCPVGLHLNID